jgi:hypothetical protein
VAVGMVSRVFRQLAKFFMSACVGEEICNYLSAKAVMANSKAKTISVIACIR